MTKRTTSPMLAALTAVGLFFTSPALAREGDIEACAGLEEGDDCTRADGDPGVCQPDESDPNVIKCDDDAIGTGDGSSDDGSVECSFHAGSGAPHAALVLTLAGLFFAFRRRA